ncbi:hypothetical protein [Roseateles sp.]|uniref:hypothetical protein n=1 Tax=Roseateles sp. TaxID=1971397 RepID=UPI003BA7B419
MTGSIYKQKRSTAAVLLALASLGAGAAQTDNIDLGKKLFGINYWYHNPGNWNTNTSSLPLPSSTTPWLVSNTAGSCYESSSSAAGSNDCFLSYRDKVVANGVTLVRIGGTNLNNQFLSESAIKAMVEPFYTSATGVVDKGGVDAAVVAARANQVARIQPMMERLVDRVKASSGLEPLVQLPINMPADDRSAWITMLYGRGVKYFSIGNEPDLASRLSPKFAQTLTAIPTVCISNCSTPATAKYIKAETVYSGTTNNVLSRWYAGQTASTTMTVTLKKGRGGTVDATKVIGPTTGDVALTIDGNTYKDFRDKFVAWATAVKQAHSDATIVGPDFATAFGYDAASTAFQPLLSLHKCFISDVGNKRLNGNGVPLLDVYSVHMYASWNESEANRRMTVLQDQITRLNKGSSNPASDCDSSHQYEGASANTSRSSDPLTLAVTEVNGTYTSDHVNTSTAFSTSTETTTAPSDLDMASKYAMADGAAWHFDAGQFQVTMLKQMAKHSGFAAVPWSVWAGESANTINSTNLFNKNGTPRSTAAHLKALAKNSRAKYMPGWAQLDVLDDKLVQFAMTDENGSTVMIMNTTGGTKPGVGGSATTTAAVASAQTLNYIARLDGTYSNTNLSTSKDAVNLKFTDYGIVTTVDGADVQTSSKVQWKGSVPAKTTHMFTFDANGKRLQKWVYNKADHDLALVNGQVDTSAVKDKAVGTTTDLAIGAKVTATSGELKFSAVPPTVISPVKAEPRTKYEFFFDGVSVGKTEDANKKDAAGNEILDAKGKPILVPAELDFKFPYTGTYVAGEHDLVVKATDKDGNVDESPASWIDVTDAMGFVQPTNLTVYRGSPVQYGGTYRLMNNGPALGKVRVTLTGLSSTSNSTTLLSAKYIDENRRMNDYWAGDLKVDLKNNTILVPQLCANCELLVITKVRTKAGNEAVSASYVPNSASSPASYKLKVMVPVATPVAAAR